MTLAAVLSLELPTRRDGSVAYPETWVFDLSVRLGCIALCTADAERVTRPESEPESTLPATAVHTSPPFPPHE